MSEFLTRPVPANFKDAHINAETYQAMYQRSLEDPEGFWSEMANAFLSWEKAWDRVVRYDFANGEAEWFAGRSCLLPLPALYRPLPLPAHCPIRSPFR